MSAQTNVTMPKEYGKVTLLLTLHLLYVFFKGFMEYYTRYMQMWVSFHRYWLETYQGNLKVMFYSDMVKNERLFSELAEFFGYSTEAYIMR